MEHDEKVNHDVQDPVAGELPDWTLKYPDEYRKLLSIHGDDDRDDKTLEAFNYEIIDLAKYCQGKPHAVLEMLIRWLHEDWHTVLLGRRTKGSSMRSAAIARERAAHLPESKMVELLGDGRLPGEPGWLISDDEGGLRRATADESRAKYLAIRTGVAFSDAGLRRLKTHGYGPVQPHVSYSLDRRALDRWASHVFGPLKLGAELFPAQEQKGWKPGMKPWLYMAADGPDADFVCHHLIAWGGPVVGPVELALEAAQIASHAELAGAILEVDTNVEASLVICDILLRRHIRFVAIARQIIPPPIISCGGVVLQGNVRMEEIRWALEALPARSTAGMDFSIGMDLVWG
jgi:hypothetical protein